MSEGPRVFLDACVLVPDLPRRLLLSAADLGLCAPLWSPRVLAEWRIAALRRGAEAALLDGLAARMATRWPGAEGPADPDLEARLAATLPDPGDAHVIAAAAGRVETILTFNLRDFPARALAAHGLAARNPDGFLWEILSHHPGFSAAIDAELSAFGAEGRADGRRLLKRARLSHLGKAWEQGG